MAAGKRPLDSFIASDLLSGFVSLTQSGSSGKVLPRVASTIMDHIYPPCQSVAKDPPPTITCRRQTTELDGESAFAVLVVAPRMVETRRSERDLLFRDKREEPSLMILVVWCQNIY